MKKTVILITLTLALVSCVKQWQLASLESNKLALENNQMIYTDSLVEITYDFYSNNAIMDFIIYNHSEVPVYIDWKNSFFIVNNESFPYWEDRTIVQSTSSSQTRPSIWNSSVLNTWGYQIEESYRENRVSMIPPHTKLQRMRFKVNSRNYITAFLKDTLEVKKSWIDGKRLTTVIHGEFTEEDSPLKFRNFLTLGTSEDFDQPIHYDFHFWIAELDEMDSRQIEGDWQVENYPAGFETPTKYRPYKSPHRFIIK